MDDPPRPSHRAPAAWQRRLRGDLDVIVAKALRKEPARRYASVLEMREDIRRHLAGRPVQARRQTVGYRARRFAKRHAWSLASATAIMLLILAYAISMAVQRGRTERALAEATVSAMKAEQVTEFMLGLFQASERGQIFADTLTARELLDRGIARARRLTGQPEVRAQMLDAVGHIQLQLGDFDAARAVFEESLATRRSVLGRDHADVATSLANVAFAAHRLGDYDAAIPLRSEALAIRRGTLGNVHPATLETIYWHAHTLHVAGDADAAQPLFDEWIAGLAGQPAEITPQRATQYVNLGQILTYRGDHAGAERLVHRAIDIRRQVFGERHVSVARAISELAGVYIAAGRLHEAEQAERQALEMLRSLYPEGHPDLADAIRGLAVVVHRQRRWQEAEQLYLERLHMVRRFFGDEHMHVATASEDLGLLHHRQQHYDRAEPYLRDAVRLYHDRVGAQSLLTRRAEVVLGDVLRAKGHQAEAERYLRGGYAALSERNVPGFGFALRLAVESLTKLYDAQGRADEAAKYRALGAAPRASN